MVGGVGWPLHSALGLACTVQRCRSGEAVEAGGLQALAILSKECVYIHSRVPILIL